MLTLYRARGGSLALATIGALAGALALAAPAAALEQTLTAADGATNDVFGDSVAIDGDTLVAGAAVDEGRGAVYVYQRSGDTWTQTAKLTATDAAANDFLGASVAIDGDTIVAGAFGDDVGANADQGSVYTFARTGAATRTQTAKLTATDGAPADNLGFSVAIDGDTIVGGARGDNVGAVDEGSAYTFARTGAATRTQTAKLTASSGFTGDALGESVAIDGDTIVAGVPGFDRVGKTDKGAAYTFTRAGDVTRVQTAVLEATDAATGDKLGSSVAIAGDTIVAGAPDDDVGANANQGSAYTFARSGATPRGETAKLTASDGAPDDLLGSSVAADGETVVAGAFGANADQGFVYTFARTGATTRTQTTKLTGSGASAGDELGDAVAVDGDAIVAGAPLDDIGATVDQGSAQVFFNASADTTSPDTTGLTGPKRVERGKKAKFSFGSSEPGSSFLCRVDVKKFKSCASPAKVKTRRLKPGKHSFTVAAVDAAGNTDATAARVRFKVVRGVGRATAD